MCARVTRKLCVHGHGRARLVLVEHLLKVLAQVGGHAQIGRQQAALQRRGVDGPAQAPASGLAPNNYEHTLDPLLPISASRRYARMHSLYASRRSRCVNTGPRRRLSVPGMTSGIYGCSLNACLDSFLTLLNMRSSHHISRLMSNALRKTARYQDIELGKGDSINAHVTLRSTCARRGHQHSAAAVSAHLWKPTTTQGTLARLVLASCRSATANFCSHRQGAHLAQRTWACTPAQSTAQSPTGLRNAQSCSVLHC